MIWHQLHWSFEDPAGVTGSEEEKLMVFRRVRDEIAEHVKAFAQREGLMSTSSLSEFRT